MNKLTVVLNDYGANIKSYITYDQEEIIKLRNMWEARDERLVALHVLDPFVGYEKWCELTPNHYRILISRALNVLAELTAQERAQTSNENVSMLNFLVLAFIFTLENATMSEIEHFRINRFDGMNVTFDYSASFEVQYDRPLPKGATVVPESAEPARTFSIVVDNTDEPSED